MQNIDLNELKPLTVITGNSFSGKTNLLNEISKETREYSKFININTEVDFNVTKELKDFFKFIFGVKFVEPAKISYALKIISVGLSCKQGELLIIENPEIGLHPKAASKMAKFLTYLVSWRGVNVVIETNSTEMVNSVCYEVFIRNILAKDVLFLNKADKNSIKKTFVNTSGKFININKDLVKYPSGFFDANQKELFALTFERELWIKLI